MAKEKGTKVLLKVAAAGSPSVFTALQGQRTGTFAGSSDPIDVSDKTQDGWKAYLPGLKDGTISVTGFPVWGATPDVLEQIRAAQIADTPIECRLVLNDAGAYYHGNFYVTQFEISGNHDGATEYSIQLSPDGALDYAASGG
ncbi:MAG: phage major tail protein, TP901-1 family [Alphaproteobacteria bacterium]|nr:phage major tail protein, TP901-1 family [Alphaproteobacteria bacterium]